MDAGGVEAFGGVATAVRERLFHTREKAARGN
jgi:hypothetical protein